MLDDKFEIYRKIHLKECEEVKKKRSEIEEKLKSLSKFSQLKISVIFRMKRYYIDSEGVYIDILFEDYEDDSRSHQEKWNNKRILYGEKIYTKFEKKIEKYLNKKLKNVEIPEEANKCLYCGQEFDRKAKFCPHCGTPIGAIKCPIDEINLLRDRLRCRRVDYNSGWNYSYSGSS